MHVVYRVYRAPRSRPGPYGTRCVLGLSCMLSQTLGVPAVEGLGHTGHEGCMGQGLSEVPGVLRGGCLRCTAWKGKVSCSWPSVALRRSVGLSASMGLGSLGPEVQRIMRRIGSRPLRA